MGGVSDETCFFRLNEIAKLVNNGKSAPTPDQWGNYVNKWLGKRNGIDFEKISQKSQYIQSLHDGSSDAHTVDYHIGDILRKHYANNRSGDYNEDDISGPFEYTFPLGIPGTDEEIFKKPILLGSDTRKCNPVEMRGYVSAEALRDEMRNLIPNALLDLGTLRIAFSNVAKYREDPAYTPRKYDEKSVRNVLYSHVQAVAGKNGDDDCDYEEDSESGEEEEEEDDAVVGGGAGQDGDQGDNAVVGGGAGQDGDQGDNAVVGGGAGQDGDDQMEYVDDLEAEEAEGDEDEPVASEGSLSDGGDDDDDDDHGEGGGKKSETDLSNPRYAQYMRPCWEDPHFEVGGWKFDRGITLYREEDKKLEKEIKDLYRACDEAIEEWNEETPLQKRKLSTWKSDAEVRKKIEPRLKEISTKMRELENNLTKNSGDKWYHQHDSKHDIISVAMQTLRRVFDVFQIFEREVFRRHIMYNEDNGWCLCVLKSSAEAAKLLENTNRQIYGVYGLLLSQGMENLFKCTSHAAMRDKFQTRMMVDLLSLEGVAELQTTVSCLWSRDWRFNPHEQILKLRVSAPTTTTERVRVARQNDPQVRKTRKIMKEAGLDAKMLEKMAILNAQRLASSTNLAAGGISSIVGKLSTAAIDAQGKVGSGDGKFYSDNTDALGTSIMKDVVLGGSVEIQVGEKTRRVDFYNIKWFVESLLDMVEHIFVGDQYSDTEDAMGSNTQDQINLFVSR
jgi:hypothetical protein